MNWLTFVSMKHEKPKIHIFNQQEMKEQRRELRADGTAAEAKLCVELDGQSHYTPEGVDYDRVRTGFIQSKTVCK